jgi:hypothetical protein
MTAYGYCVQDFELSQSVNQRMEIVQKIARSHSVELFRVYSDHGYGVFLQWRYRPGLRLLVRRLKLGDVLVVPNVFVFGFSMNPMVLLFRRLRARKIVVIEERGAFHCSRPMEFSRLMAPIRNLAIRERRIKNALAWRREHGVIKGDRRMLKIRKKKFLDRLL